MYWLEKGGWMYFEDEQLPVYFGPISLVSRSTYQHSTSCWWFIVTGELQLDTVIAFRHRQDNGKRSLAMLLGILVITFPVSVFSNCGPRNLLRLKELYLSGSDDSDDRDEDACRGMLRMEKKKTRTLTMQRKE
jgi:hypothetical protein